MWPLYFRFVPVECCRKGAVLVNRGWVPASWNEDIEKVETAWDAGTQGPQPGPCIPEFLILGYLHALGKALADACKDQVCTVTAHALFPFIQAVCWLLPPQQSLEMACSVTGAQEAGARQASPASSSQATPGKKGRGWFSWGRAKPSNEQSQAGVLARAGLLS